MGNLDIEGLLYKSLKVIGIKHKKIKKIIKNIKAFNLSGIKYLLLMDI